MKIFKLVSLAALLAFPFGLGCGNSKISGKGDGGVATGGRGGTGVVPDGGGLGGSGGVGGVGGSGAVGGAGGVGVGGNGGAGPIEFTDFVNDLIINKTSSAIPPESIDDKTFKDSMNPAAFDQLFQ